MIPTRARKDFIRLHGSLLPAKEKRASSRYLIYLTEVMLKVDFFLVFCRRGVAVVVERTKERHENDTMAKTRAKSS